MIEKNMTYLDDGGVTSGNGTNFKYYINIGCGGGIALEKRGSSEHRQTIISEK